MEPEQDIEQKTNSSSTERDLDRDKDICANRDQKTKERAQNRVVLSTACFGFICIFLLAAIVVLHIKLMADKDIEVTHMLQSNSRCQTEKDQLQSNFNSLSEKNQELKKRVNDPTFEISHSQGNFDSFKQKNQELEKRVNQLSYEKSQLQGSLDSLNQTKLELEKTVNNLTSEKSQLQGSFDSLNQESQKRVNNLTSEYSQLQRGFESLSQKNQESEKRVNDLSSKKNQLQRNFDSLNQKNQESEKRVNQLSSEKSQLQGSFDSLNQTKLDLEKTFNNLTSEKSQLQRSFDSLSQKNLELKTELKKLFQKELLFWSSEAMNWSDSRQYCRDHGADLVIIKSEDKQKFISSFVKEIVWIGLSDIENEGEMKWVDNSSLTQGFWFGSEPNNAGGDEDCVDLIPSYAVLKNWNDAPCSLKRRGICEK